MPGVEKGSVDAPTVAAEWQGRPIEAANPPAIARASFDLAGTTIRRTEQAAAAVRRAGDRASGTLEVAGRLLLRAEGLASSAIEGLRATAADVALAEAAGPDAEADAIAAWVADNLAVVTAALAEPGRVTVKRLLAWHTRLMRHAQGIDDAHVGAWRDRIGWVGGPNPVLAAHVGARPDAVDALMKDLVTFCNRDDLDPVTHAAVAHAQFETIHPFADGNGRIGRILVGVVLAHRLQVTYPPPVSLEFARDVGGYQSGLTLYRQGNVDAWVAWFADAVANASARTLTVLDAVAELEARWAGATATLRADSAARRLLTLLPAHPVLSADTVNDLLGVSGPAARAALTALADAGVVNEIEPIARGAGRPRRWWVADDLLALIGR
jgi:Fic family protein